MFFSKKDFEIAELRSFLLPDCQGVKAPFGFDFAKRMTLPVKVFVFRKDQLLLTCFQMSFLNALRESAQVLQEKRKI